ncbi:protein diaphanous homolog 3 isoform X3 [Hypanus sabinus]|uniref:protein diaphanous homolog 3 isoform X3 n=1 Tax=Hypanus sabinus TaxID=79690 RepID=UPI0028C443C3|nr:protein diaphanous homolog 3 isoform X3 [Hypanus sabinus]
MALTGAGGCTTPQLSNNEQIKLLNAVKNREITVDQAWEIAQSGKSTVQEASEPDKVPVKTSYNFFVYKYNRYRWQKRILMIDYNSRMLCNIEKGMIKKQFPFKSIKSCEHIEGEKFSISFLIHHDYELEATSAEDRIKIIQLVNQIIQNNMNDVQQTNPSADSPVQKETGVIKEGQIELQTGGFTSVKWNGYHMQLYKGKLSFLSLGIGEADEQLGLPPNIIYLSDGNTSVHKEVENGSFTIITKKNCYLLRIPVTEKLKSAEDLRKFRDEWVDAIDKCCLHWKRLSQSQFSSENTFYEVIPFTLSRNETNEQQILKQPDFYEDQIQEKEQEKEQKAIERKKRVKEEFEPTSPVKSPLRSLAISPLHQHVPTSPVQHQKPGTPTAPPIPAKRSIGVVRKTKPFHWEKVDLERIPKSIWEQSHADKIQLHYPSLFDQFAVQEMATQLVNEFSTHQNILLNQKIAHNFNIFLISFPVKVTQLKMKLFIIREEDGGLTNEQITSLRRYVPTPSDIEKYNAYKGSQSDLHIVDQYMMEMCNIPYLSQRLDIILALRELPETIEDLQPLIRQKIKACLQLQNCKLFVSVLNYLLAVGNFLNKNAGNEIAKGFSLSSLPKLVLLRGKDKAFTLLHALVDQIMSQEPGLTKFPQELTEFEEVPGDSIKGLIAEVDGQPVNMTAIHFWTVCVREGHCTDRASSCIVLKNEMAKIILHKKTLKPKNKNSSDWQFYNELKSIIQKYEDELSQLNKQCDEMKTLYNDILVRFGEPQDRDSEVMFGWISSFIKNFKRAVTEQSKRRLESAQK